MSDNISIVSICNSAFAKIGVERINDIDEDNEQARYATQRFQPVLDALIESHPWNFAIVRTQLTKDTVAPAFGYTKRYLLPAGGNVLPRCLRVLEEVSGYTYNIEGRYLLCDYDIPAILYLGQITEERLEMLPPLFVEALSDRLAADAAFLLLGDMNKEQLMLQRFGASVKAAMFSDSMQGTPKERPEGSWITSRR